MKMIRIVALVVVALLAVDVHAEYSSRKVRYASTYDVLNLLNKNFPGHGQKRPDAIPLKCDSVNEFDRDVLGGSSPISGQPLMEKPNPGLIRWLNQCLGIYARFEFAPDVPYRSDFASTYLPKSLQNEKLEELMLRKWSSLTPDTQSALVDRIAQRMIGPLSVYQSYAGNKPWSEFTTSVEKTMSGLVAADATVADGMATAAQTVFLRDEFLRY